MQLECEDAGEGAGEGAAAGAGVEPEEQRDLLTRR